MANKLGYFDNFINDLTERSGNMLTITGDTTVLTNENYEVLIAILEEMRNCLSNDLDMADLSDRAGDVLSRDYRRLRTIQEQLALTMETFKL